MAAQAVKSDRRREFDRPESQKARKPETPARRTRQHDFQLREVGQNRLNLLPRYRPTQ